MPFLLVKILEGDTIIIEDKDGKKCYDNPIVTTLCEPVANLAELLEETLTVKEEKNHV